MLALLEGRGVCVNANGVCNQGEAVVVAMEWGIGEWGAEWEVLSSGRQGVG